jgi:hypothetical protein
MCDDRHEIRCQWDVHLHMLHKMEKCSKDVQMVWVCSWRSDMPETSKISLYRSEAKQINILSGAQGNLNERIHQLIESTPSQHNTPEINGMYKLPIEQLLLILLWVSRLGQS